MIQQPTARERLKENAIKFDNLLSELDGMKFMDLKTKDLYEITGYQNSLRSNVTLELYNSQAESSDSEFLYVVLEDSSVETAIAAVYEQGLVPIVIVPAPEEPEEDESEEECDFPLCLQGETDNIERDLMEMVRRMKRRL